MSRNFVKPLSIGCESLVFFLIKDFLTFLFFSHFMQVLVVNIHYPCFFKAF